MPFHGKYMKHDITTVPWERKKFKKMKPIKKDEETEASKPTEEPKPEEPKKPGKKTLKRMKRRDKLVSEGKIEKTELDVEELMRKDAPVALAVRDCQDEVELRNRFPSGGTAGVHSKYFFMSKYVFKFKLSKDGIAVAQICDKTAVKGQWTDE
mmetsp:Transcript_16476/g.35529  ORF Transcript_16476/g.35529 Transcript_16476/m.35529 type:complete len:153 (-) Transcript_16476:49-507(-)|eukprot:CAMPEP_0206562510 /NCGR_PEP_ID=MMETSP0325_2-20121206/22283_1 /ASSEMBLY_ACC=CAM_ASM_000347 /TAXON_ID=2866 /ORGANISM="Crypthecodinium cohnii, Strain Seligo" /LENGTH=152 /DNA_ID=CAMNT_0054064717 /DNA_START=112 /DNA_END=570 /DNA_ORIENTATION=+